MASKQARPVLALAMGDPAGISLELAAKLMADDEARSLADYIVVGDSRAFAEGSKVAGVSLDLPVWHPGDGDIDLSQGAVIADLGHYEPGAVERGKASKAGGAFALANFRTVLRLANRGGADAATFTPFNKNAMRLAFPPYVDEIEVITAETGATYDGREFNILGNLWNARVTSHVPLSGVAELITKDRVLGGIRLTNESMKAAGFEKPRIAVAALNPHAGDGGNFGHEDDAETVFLRAKRGDYDVVQTMYHDQGQIAMKLMGFELGVTLIGGYGFHVCTPAHGTAYDIAGQGIANLGATREAMRVAARMAEPKGTASSERARLLNECMATGERSEAA